MNMNVVRLTLLVCACIFYSDGLSAQLPTFEMPLSYEVASSENSGYYKRQMEKLGKQNDKLRAACANALKLLTPVGKGRHKDDAIEFLTANFKKAVENSESTVAQLKSEITEFQGEVTAKKAQEIVVIFLELEQMKQLSEECEKKGAYIVPAYPNEMENAMTARKSIFEKTAQMYFEEVQRDLPSAQNREDYYSLAKKLERALKYDQREDIQLKMREIEPMATVNFGIGLITDRSGNAGISGNDMRSDLYSRLQTSMQRGKSVWPFFTLAPNDESLVSGKSNVMITVEIRAVNVQETPDKTVSKDHSRKIKDSQKEITVTAKYTEYGKTVETKIEGFYTIKDMQTGKTLKSNTISVLDSWRHEWASYTGDERALDKRQKEKAKTGDKPTPPSSELARGAVNKLVVSLSNVVVEFANEVGR
jgi:hypothetical protein